MSAVAKLKNTAQNVAGNPTVRKTRRTFNKFWFGTFSKFRVTSILYHFVAFFTFSREQQAVLKGKSKYYKNLSLSPTNSVLLRRNTHRLEKGLSMKNVRKFFARNYIEETVNEYERVVSNNETHDDSEIIWAHDVLERYFDHIETDDEMVLGLEKKFRALPFKKKDEEQKAPFLRQLGDKPPVSYDDMLDLAMRRRSVRWFEDKKVPRELIDKALLIARQSPSACNRLPYEFRIFDDPKLVKEIANVPFGTTGYADDIPVIGVIVGKLENYFSPRDRHAIYVDSSLAAMSFVFALETLGLSSTLINWPDFEPLEMKMQKKLGLSVDERPIMLVAIGYPDKSIKVPYSQKKDLDSMRRYN